MTTFESDLQHRVSIVPSSPSSKISQGTQTEGWVTFEQMLQRLHKDGIYIHAEQLAEFLLSHGLPVHLQYVPPRLRQKAETINQQYQGDMAQLVEEWDTPY